MKTYMNKINRYITLGLRDLAHNAITEQGMKDDILIYIGYLRDVRKLSGRFCHNLQIYAEKQLAAALA